MLTRDQLPNDVEQLKAIILKQQALYEQRIQALEHQLQLLLRQQYGQRSEKAKVDKKPPNHSTTSNPRGRLPEHLPRQEAIYTLPTEQLACPGCGQARRCIGEEITEQLDYSPGRLHVIRHKRQKYACSSCQEEIVKQSQQPGRVHTAMDFIGQLYQIEREGKDLTYEQRYQHRQQYSQSILDKFKLWLDEQTTLPKSPLGKAIAYTLNHWQALSNYLLDGCLNIDNNSAERAILPYLWQPSQSAVEA